MSEPVRPANQVTILLKLTLAGPVGMQPHSIYSHWLEHTPMQVGPVRITAGQIVAGGMNGDDQLIQLPVDEVHCDDWKLRRPGQVGSVQNRRLATPYYVVYADPDGSDTKPYVVLERGVDNLDGTATPGEVQEPQRFGTARQVADCISEKMWAECSEGEE